jgi:hypothetical protein
MTYRRKRITSGGRTVVRRMRSPKTGSRPGRGWFTWAWGGRRRGRSSVPAFFGFEKLFLRRVRRR